jgi:methyl-accepting chemotaxis protein
MASDNSGSRVRWFGLAPKLVGASLLSFGFVAILLVERATALLNESLLRAGMAQDLVDVEAQHLRAALSVVAAGAAALALVAQALVVRSIVTRPISELTRVTIQIAREGDLTSNVIVRSHDEIGQLASALAAMVEPLRAIPNGIRDSTQRLADSVAKLSASTHEQSARRWHSRKRKPRRKRSGKRRHWRRRRPKQCSSMPSARSR